MHKNFNHSEKIHQTEKGLYIGDVVYGANDGIITTFAVISGAAGASLPAGTIVILGLASLIADGISMGLSNYLAVSSRLAYQKQERLREEYEVENFPKIEREEVRDILVRWGVPEIHMEETLDSITSNKERWIDLMMKEELGIFEDKVVFPIKHGIVTTSSFIIFGFLPLIPYVFGADASSQFSVSLTATAISLFIVGATRALITGTNWVKSGLQMLTVGTFAALIAYAVGAVVKALFNISI